jgi:hypothetical protein
MAPALVPRTRRRPLRYCHALRPSCFSSFFNVRNPGVPDISVFLRPQSQSLAPQGFGSGVDLTLLYVSLSGSLIALSWEPRT